MYVGTEKGVFVLRIATTQFERLPMDIHSMVSNLSFDKDGSLWVATMNDGIWQYVPETAKVKHYPLKRGPRSVAQILVDQSNQIWAVTNWGTPVVLRLNRLHDQFEPVALQFEGNYEALRMLQTHDGQMWLGTWESGLPSASPPSAFSTSARAADGSKRPATTAVVAAGT